MVTALNRKGFIGLISLVLLLLILYLLPLPCDAQVPDAIRVAIAQDAVSLKVEISGPFEVVDAKSNKRISSGRDLNTTVVAYHNGILLGDIRSDTERLLMKTEGAGVISVNGRRFRQGIECIRKSNGRLLVINTVELDDYIKGILYHEASHYWPDEALKAQAIVCRTYAAYQVQENAAKEYDVTSDTYSQVYGGRTSERYRTSRVVEATKGLVISFQDKLIPAYYHATCGGHTEDASLLWKIDCVPLRGVVCGFCKESPHFSWHAVLSLREISKKLEGAGIVSGAIQDISPAGRSGSGRIVGLTVRTSKKDVTVSAKDFRNSIGPAVIRSTNFTVTIAGTDAVFEGLGWGHGVGMCQWGAYFMAKEGRTYEEIVKYYYPGCSIISIAK